uniref:arylacetamide deacetylase isoform X3 n=1 Tax=Ciona intestinalis TaxID=7719 RepID=UPI000180B76A|nr:arylacetamide deacetylase isoform X3 [Ciona intestinalis]|eukprot:XP_002125860.1 arylacetamide deacetylase isoform X3 [Ciona intestinalis]
MGILKKVGLTIAVSVVLFGYIIHRPIPHDVPHRFKYQMLIDVVSFQELLASVTEKLGYSRWWSYRAIPKPPSTLPDGMKVENKMLGGVETVIITPRSFQAQKEPGPAIIHFHGGGWIMGNTDTTMMLLLQAAEETGFVVMSPEYRLAPEHPFPAPYDDCMNSTISFMKSSKRFNVDPKKIILSGDSAGGNLAMAVYIGLIEMQASDPTVELPAMQTLLYPILQTLNFMTPSYEQSREFMFNNNLLPKFWLAYIGLNDQLELADVVARNSHVDKSDVELIEKWNLVSPNLIPDKYKRGDKVFELDDVVYEDTLNGDVRKLMKQMILNTKISPLLASNEIISKIKKTLVLVCEYDPLRDDGILLVERIKSLGGSAELHHLPTSLHAASHIGASMPGSYYYQENKIFFKSLKDAIFNV